MATLRLQALIRNGNLYQYCINNLRNVNLYDQRQQSAGTLVVNGTGNDDNGMAPFQTARFRIGDLKP